MLNFWCRYNDKLIRWDEGDDDDDSWQRRQLDTKQAQKRKLKNIL